MARTSRSSGGYTLIELLTVLAILGILVIVGASFLRRPKNTAVRTVMDQIEGALMQAQKSAQSTGQDVVVAVNGTWTAAGTPSLSGTSPFILDPRIFQSPSTNPDAYAGARVGATSEIFTSLYAQGGRDHMDAGVATDTTGNGFAATLANAAPFTSSTDTSFAAALANRLCTGGQNFATCNGVTYRFASTYLDATSEYLEIRRISIVVVALAAGVPDSSGPVGVLVVPKNSANVFRFYKPAGATTWIRI